MLLVPISPLHKIKHRQQQHILNDMKLTGYEATPSQIYNNSICSALDYSNYDFHKLPMKFSTIFTYTSITQLNRLNQLYHDLKAMLV